MQKPDSFDDTAPEPKKQRTVYYSNNPIHDAVINREQPSARNAGSTSLLDENLVFVEICCGCARLSKECQSKGLRSLGIDWKGCKDKPEGRVIWLDLTIDHGMSELMDILEANKKSLKVVFMSPPCGTASRAREIRRFKKDARGKVLDPKPLRSDDHPDGLPTLYGAGLAKVKAANKLYENMIKLALWSDANKLIWIIENPSNSHMWETKHFKELRTLKWQDKLQRPYSRCQFQNCMHGGDRPKKTTLLNAGIDLSSLELMCDNSHSHKPWGFTKVEGVFATAEERRYPRLLCQRLATLFQKQFGKKRVILTPNGDNLVAANKQPRRCMAMLSPNTETEPVVAQVGLDTGTGSTLEVEKEQEVDPIDFVNNAKRLRHPFDQPVKLPPSLVQALGRMAELGPHDLGLHRQNSIEWYQWKEEELATKEKHLHSMLDKGVETVVESKKILLFKTMLEDIKYDDMEVVNLLVSGVKVVGTLERVGIWRPDDKPAKLSLRAALHGSTSAKDDIRRAKQHHWTDIDDQLVSCTYAEVTDGHLMGPFKEEEIDERIGSSAWLPARRFPLDQKGKLRPIDDFSEFGHNDAFGSREKVSLKNIDSVVALSRAWLESDTGSGLVTFTDSAGKESKFPLHEGWGVSGWSDLKGRVTDLKGAYKQLPRHSAHRCFSVIALREKDGKTSFFETLSLMFGQTAAVYGFLRFSRALAAIATSIFLIPCVEFFDDFTEIEPSMSAQGAHETFEAFLGLLGWKVSMGDKNLPFMKKFVSLGVSIELPIHPDKNIVLSNKPGRIEAIRVDVNRVLASPKPFGFRDALSFRGRFAFAEGQTFGRVLAPVARVLSKWASEKRPRLPSEELLLAIAHGITHLETAGPRVVGPGRNEPPVLVFTDGACEPEGTTVGGVVFSGNIVEAFGFKVSQAQVDSWKTKLNQEQVIGQAELFPVLVAKWTWAKLLTGRRCIFFIDNEAARLGLVKAYSPVLPSLAIIMDCLSWDYRHKVDSWYSRVPSKSNISDGPSRLDFSSVLNDLGAKLVEPIFPQVPAR